MRWNVTRLKTARGISKAAIPLLACTSRQSRVAARFGAALVARHPPTDAAEPDESVYEFAITYDRDLVIAAAQSLMQRIESRQMPRM
jgi:rRNA-processing protein FCF1